MAARIRPIFSYGSYNVKVIPETFKPGSDPDLAWAKVQNKLQHAMPSLPEVVQRQGVKVSKSTRNYLIIVGIIPLFFVGVVKIFGRKK